MNIVNQVPDDEKSLNEDLIRLKSQILAMHELLDVADDNVIQQAQKLEKLNNELALAKEELEKKREDTLSYLAHDINIQLVGQRMLLDYLKELEIDSEYSNLVETLVKSNDRIFNTIKNLLDVDKYDSTNYDYNFQEADLIELCLKAIEKTKYLSVSRNVKVVTEFGEDLTEVKLDKVSIEHAIETLVQNAVLSSSRGQVVILKVALERSQVVMSISDNGDSSQLASKKQLFERFWRGERGEELSENLPFELFTLSQIIKAHKGRTYFEELDDTDTRMVVTLSRGL